MCVEEYFGLLDNFVGDNRHKTFSFPFKTLSLLTEFAGPDPRLKIPSLIKGIRPPPPQETPCTLKGALSREGITIYALAS